MCYVSTAGFWTTPGCHNIGIRDRPKLLRPEVTGSIHNQNCRSFWSDTLQAGSFLMDLIQFGYTLPLAQYPPHCALPNNKSALEEPLVVEDFLYQYEAAGCLVATNEPPHLVLPLSVVYSNKTRLVVDGSRNLNPYLRKRSIKLSHLDSANQGLKKGQWFATCDLESGYHQVLIKPSQRKLLGISWTRNGRTQYWVWRTLFLGVRDAVYIFSKLLRPHITLCKSLGIFITIYIDDMRIVAGSRDDCARFFKLAMGMLTQAGWRIKSGKGIWNPTQKGEFLGLVHDLTTLKYYIPDRKLEDIKSFGSWILLQRKVQVRKIASFYGKLSSCSLALGPCAGLLSREGHRFIAEESEISWNFYARIPKDMKKEIQTILDLLPKLNGFPIHQTQSLTPSRMIATDASATGLAGLEVRCGSLVSSASACSASCADSLMVHRKFSDFELAQSSTYRELVALWDLYFLRSREFKGQSILHFTDNSNVPTIITKGSPKPLLQSLAKDIFEACHANDVALFVQWVPRTNPHLLLPDFYSREHDLSDWGLENSSMDQLLRTCPFPLEVDLFASEHNHRLPCFLSKNACPSAFGINAFTFNWSWFGPGLCVPPPDLIQAAIEHIVHCKAKGLMIVPLWRSADFWLSLCPDGRHINSIFFDGFQGRLPLVCAPHLNRVFNGIPSFSMLYLLYDGDCELPNVSFKVRGRCTEGGCSMCDN